MDILPWLNKNAVAAHATATVALVFVTIIYAYLTYRISNLNKTLVELTYRSHLQPVLIFHRTDGEISWRIKNVSNAPALNVLVTGGNHKKEWDKELTAVIPAISPDEGVILDWIVGKGKTDSFCAIYCDASGKVHTSECIGNRNSVFKGNKHPSLEANLFL